MTLGAVSIPVTLAVSLSRCIADAPVSVPIQLEMIAVVAASIGGALAARDRNLDLTGSVGLAVVCSLGGGLLRDIILQVGDVYILNQPLALPIAIATAGIVFLFPRLVANQDRLIAILDIFAVGLFAATGADKALVYGFEPLVAVMMGFFTGVGGGMIRDLCVGETPYIFQRGNLYAIACIVGAATYVALLETGMVSNITALVVCVAVTMLLRWLSLHYNILSPTEVDLHQVAVKTRHIARATTRAPRHTRRRKNAKR